MMSMDIRHVESNDWRVVLGCRPNTCVRQNSVISILLYNKSILQL